MGNFIDISGKSFGKWKVLHRAESSTRRPLWRCRCHCGAEKDVLGENLRSGHSGSCTKCWRIGVGNSKAKKLYESLGDRYIASTDKWYRLIQGRWHYAKNNGIAIGFNTKQEFAEYCKIIAPTKCPILGVPLVFGGGKSGPLPNGYSVDRIVPENGYVRENIQIISVKANMIKTNASREELRKFAVWVLRNL